jgi:hypothetical protein
MDAYSHVPTPPAPKMTTCGGTMHVVILMKFVLNFTLKGSRGT